jgi:two-component system C4-dicarboxylate transport sensor histidine kinase DctB
VALGLGFCGLAGWITRQLVFARQFHNLGGETQRHLEFYRLSLESVLAKNESLPRIIAMEAKLRDLLARPGDGARLATANGYLKEIRRTAGISEIFLLDRAGVTLASSNAGEPGSFVQQSYAYRPYFTGAMQGGFGRFYGIGATTGVSGYFLAAPIDAGAGRIGATVVKVSLDDFEAALLKSGDMVLLVDGSGVVFLCSAKSWKYKTLEPLDASAQAALRLSRQYRELDLQPLAARLRLGPGSSSVRVAVGSGPPQDFLVQSSPVGQLDWHLMLLKDTRQERQAALMAGIAAAFAGAFLLSLATYGRLNRKRFRERREADAALRRAHEDLERRIAERTSHLVATKASLEDRVAALNRTEAILRETRDDAVQAGKLAVLGQMSVGISHEINQPLTALNTFTDNAAALLERGRLPEVRENLGLIRQMADRMEHIVREIKTFGRRSSAELRSTPVEAALHQVLMLVEPRRRQLGVELEVLPVPPGLTVLVDPLRLEQVLLNLLRNALDATADRAVRRITLASVETGEGVEIRIRDSGSGLPPEVLARIFDPFFTTKPVGQGLGLGLAISRMIMEELGGRLDAGNVEDGGAEFTLLLRRGDG